MKRMLPAVLTACALLAGSANAQDVWPSKPIKFIVAYSAGGTGDLVARTIGNQLARDLKQPVVVENRPGASGMMEIGRASCRERV